MNGTEPGVVNVVDVQLFCQFNVSLALSWCDNPPCSVVVVINPPIVAMPVALAVAAPPVVGARKPPNYTVSAFLFAQAQTFAPSLNAGATIKSATPDPHRF